MKETKAKPKEKAPAMFRGEIVMEMAEVREAPMELIRDKIIEAASQLGMKMWNRVERIKADPTLAKKNRRVTVHTR